MNNAELIENNHLLDKVGKDKHAENIARAESRAGADTSIAPASPAGANALAADRKMDDDTGLSNAINEDQPVDARARQALQSNVGRRDDMTAD